MRYRKWFTTGLCILGSCLTAFGQGIDIQYSLGESKITVSGRVTDAASGTPIPGALVRASILVWANQGPELFEASPRTEVKTDATGQYRIEITAPLTLSGPMAGKDSLCVSASAPGYQTAPRYADQRVAPDKTDFPGMDIALEKGKRFTGVVVDHAGRPVPEAVVLLQNNHNGDWNYYGHLGKAVTNAEGRFECWIGEKLTHGDHTPTRLRISKLGQGLAYVFGPFEKEGPGAIALAASEVAGRVVDPEGNGVAGCEVQAWANEELYAATTTAPDGRYVLAGVPDKETLTALYGHDGRQFPKELLQLDIFARDDASVPLKETVQCRVMAPEAGTGAAAPDLVIGANVSVSGRVVPGDSPVPLAGLQVALDGSWSRMAEADAEGLFFFRNVPPGPHKLILYLPMNLRGGRGIGRTEVEVQTAQELGDVEINIDPLAEVRVRYLDIQGRPLPNITAGATWNKSGDGFWTEGTRSDETGWATLYLHPDEVQYVGGHDMDGRKYVAEEVEELTPKADGNVKELQIVMVPPSRLRGRIVSSEGQPLVSQRLAGRLRYADGSEALVRAETEASGVFALNRDVRPGLVELTFNQSMPPQRATWGPAELKPGETKDCGDVVFRAIPSHAIRGRVAPSASCSEVAGLKVRLDLEAWEPMVDTDSEGRFEFPAVGVGKHHLVAYTPSNLRTDRGIGRVDVEVGDGDLEGVELPLDALSRVNVTIVDEAGKPVEGVAAAAWWTEDHSGVFTEGPKSDAKGKATLYLHPGEAQYVGAHDWDGRWLLKAHTPLTPKKGATVDVTVVVTPAP